MMSYTGCNQISTESPSLSSVTDSRSTVTSDQNVLLPPETISKESSEDNAMVGGSTSCIHTLLYGVTELDNSYHSIDSVLIEYVGEDNFVVWIAEKESNKSTSDICPFNYINIVRFVEDFEIPRQVFENLNNNYLYLQYDYDVDAIYGGKTVAEIYYTSDRLQNVLEKKTIRLFKSKLVDYVVSQNSTSFSSWIDEKNTQIPRINSVQSIPEFTGNYNQFSYIEFINKFDIAKATAVELFEEAHSAYSSCERVLNFDAIYSDLSNYSESYSMTATSANDLTVSEQDASYFWIPDK